MLSLFKSDLSFLLVADILFRYTFGLCVFFLLACIVYPCVNACVAFCLRLNVCILVSLYARITVLLYIRMSMLLCVFSAS